MQVGVVRFPGSNCDRDMLTALRDGLGCDADWLWHQDTNLPAGLRLIVLPGGFSYGDALRAGALAARSPIVQQLRHFVAQGGYVLGVCNGFQILTEAGLLPGALMINASGRFQCREVELHARDWGLLDLPSYVSLPIAHLQGRYVADAETLSSLYLNGQVIMSYRQDVNGSVDRIASICSRDRRVVGMMPHPERAWAPWHRHQEGLIVLSSVVDLTDASTRRSAMDIYCESARHRFA